MAWYDETVFYHIYPLGMTNSPHENNYEINEHRLNKLIPWLDHIKNIGCNGIYIGPLFESVSHGYDTTDYRKLDSRLGDNNDLKEFVAKAHEKGIKVIFDGVFNHVGRDFFAFKDLKEHKWDSRYKDWFLNINFNNNNEFNDGFSYDNWGGYNILVKLNQRNPEVKDYLCDVVRYWVNEFDVDGIRLDAADVLDFDFMKTLRWVANEVKPDFWLMGEVIHGEYSRWVNDSTLHSVTDYALHKAFFSGHNDHNYFEIAHTIKRMNDMGINKGNFKLYNFVDNHDTSRIMSKLNNKAHYVPVHVLLYGLPGIPSIYYGSEFGIEGNKGRSDDYEIRPELDFDAYKDEIKNNQYVKVISKLGEAKKHGLALSYGDYQEKLLTNRQYAFTRNMEGQTIIVAVNNDDNPSTLNLNNIPDGEYVGQLFGTKVNVTNGYVQINLDGNSGDIYLPIKSSPKIKEVIKIKVEEKKEEPKKDLPKMDNIPNKPYEEMSVEELQAVILYKMSCNGPVNDQMRRSVTDNTHHGSLINWAKSFR